MERRYFLAILVIARKNPETFRVMLFLKIMKSMRMMQEETWKPSRRKGPLD